MAHLCFGSYTRILLYKAPATALSNKKLCGLLLKVFDNLYDITEDDDTVSKLLSGSQNIAPDIVRTAATINPHLVEQYFEREIIHRLNQNKKKHIVLALKELILTDSDIAPETQLGTLSDMTKAALQDKTTFAFTEFLTDIFLYAVKHTDNRVDKKNTKSITRSYCDQYEGRLHEVQLYELPQIRPVAAIPMTVKAKKFDQVFTKVAEDTLSNTHPSNLKLYRLGMDEDGIDYRKLHGFLINTIGEYVYSRVQVSEIIADDEYGTIAYKALSLMHENAAPGEKGTGNELGELLLYVFLEHVLQAPKLMSKVELAGLSTTRTSRSDGIHLLVSNGAVPFNQLVFGASMMDGKLEDAIDAALAHVIEIKNNKAKEYDLVESGMFYRSFDKEVSDRIKDIIIPQRGKVDKPPMAFGVFLGYTLGMTGDIASCVSKMEGDIKRCMEYMKQQIQVLGLSPYSFYVYVIPFNDVVPDKKEIMEKLMTLGV